MGQFISEKQIKRLLAIGHTNGVNPEKIKSYIQEKYNLDSFSKIRWADQYDAIVDAVPGLVGVILNESSETSQQKVIHGEIVSSENSQNKLILDVQLKYWICTIYSDSTEQKKLMAQILTLGEQKHKKVIGILADSQNKVLTIYRCQQWFKESKGRTKDVLINDWKKREGLS